MKTILRHALATISLTWVFANLTVWFVVLLLMVLLRGILRRGTMKHHYDSVIGWIYRAAVKLDSFWMLNVVGIRINVSGELPTEGNPIILSNHQTWFDIPVLQEIVCRHGPILRFLIKRQLVWVPVIGWICLALNFPRLYRSQRAGSGRESDYATIRDATVSLNDAPGALLIFPEGTRYTDRKHEQQESPYPQLLKPRQGGFNILQAHADPDTVVADVTISYDDPNATFWQCLYGKVKEINVNVETFTLAEIDDAATFLNERWDKKAVLLQSHRTDTSR